MRVHLVQTSVDSYQRLKRVMENIIEFTEAAVFVFAPGRPVTIQARDALLIMQVTVELPLHLFETAHIASEVRCLVNVPLLYQRLKMCDGKKSQWAVGTNNTRLYVWSASDAAGGDTKVNVPRHHVRALPDQHSQQVRDIVSLYKTTPWPALIHLNSSTLGNALLDIMVGCGETFVRYYDAHHATFGSVFENGEIYMDVPLVDREGQPLPHVGDDGLPIRDGDGNSPSSHNRWPADAKSATYVTRLLKVVSSVLMHHPEQTVTVAFEAPAAPAVPEKPVLMVHLLDPQSGVAFWMMMEPYVGPYGVKVEEPYRLFALRNA